MAAAPTASVVRAGSTSVLWTGRSIRWSLRDWRAARPLRSGTSAAPSTTTPKATTCSCAILRWVVHAFESALLHAPVAATTRRHGLTLVFLLLEHELLLSVEARPRLRSLLVHRGTRLAPTHTTLLLLHCRHLLHHGRIHTLTCHHLLHHRIVLHSRHRVHATAHVVGLHLLLHLEELDHALPVLRHHRWRHAVATTVVLAHLVLLTELVKLFLLTLPSKFRSTSTRLFTHVSARLRTLDFDRLAADRQRALEGSVNGSLTIERDKAKAARATGLFIHHQSRIEHIAKIAEEIGELLLAGILAHAANKDLGSAFLLVARNGTLRINLFVMLDLY